jgi:Peptidase inhibitor I9
VFTLVVLGLVPSGAAALGSQADGDVARLTDGAGSPPLGREGKASVEGSVLASFEDDDRVPVIVRLREQVDVAEVAPRARSAGRVLGEEAQVRTVVDELKQTAAATQPGVRDLLRSEQSAGRAGAVRSFWIFNGLAATVSRATVDLLAAHPDVASVELDEELSLPEPQSQPRLPTWSLEKVNAVRTWGD